jgi:predicted  nucleic acid-binding Zn-ribbon protein
VPPLSPLLDVQELDVAADALKQRRADLPERAELVGCHERAEQLDRELAELEARREGLSSSERKLAGEVAAMAARVKEAEKKLYSGTVTLPKELEGLQEEQRTLQHKQSELEDQELELMEQIEATEGEMASNREARRESDDRAAQLLRSIASSEAEIDGELQSLDTSRRNVAAGLPAPVLEKYAELRQNRRMAGRPAARLTARTCQGCRLELPVLVHQRIQDEGPGALVRCPQCRRVLGR